MGGLVVAKKRTQDVSTGNCGTCKHWTKPGDRTDFRTAVSASYINEEMEEKLESLADKADQKFGVCNGIYQGRYEIGEAEKPLPIALTIDGSNYFSQLMTQAKFGCVLHESV